MLCSLNINAGILATFEFQCLPRIQGVPHQEDVNP